MAGAVETEDLSEHFDWKVVNGSKHNAWVEGRVVKVLSMGSNINCMAIGLEEWYSGLWL